MDLDISASAFVLLKGLTVASKAMGQKELTVETEGDRSKLLGGVVQLEFDRLDLAEIAERGYVRITNDIGVLCRTSVTHGGRQLVNQSLGAPTMVAERQFCLSLERIGHRSPQVADSLNRAFRLALDSETQEEISEVGHNCRIALQDALDYLYQEAKLSGLKRSATKQRLEALIEQSKIGNTDRLMLQNLEVACAAASIAFERGEHRSEREGRQLNNEDAIEMVLLTFLAVSQAFRWL